MLNRLPAPLVALQSQRNQKCVSCGIGNFPWRTCCDGHQRDGVLVVLGVLGTKSISKGGVFYDNHNGLAITSELNMYLRH